MVLCGVDVIRDGAGVDGVFCDNVCFYLEVSWHHMGSHTHIISNKTTPSLPTPPQHPHNKQGCGL